MQPRQRELALSSEREFTVDVIDSWNMTIERLAWTHRGAIKVPLGGRRYMAIRAAAVD